MFALKTVTEAMQRLLLERFVAEESADIENPAALLKLVEECNRNNLNAAVDDPFTKHLIIKSGLKFTKISQKMSQFHRYTFWYMSL